MAICVNTDTDGVIRQTVQSVDDCTGYILVTPTEYEVMLETVEITPADITLVFGIAFGWVVALGALSYKIKTVMRFIRLT